MPYDAIIIGGSFAGLAAALYLGRARRSVCVLDTQKPRNRFASESHGFFGHDGANPQTILSTMRRQLSAYSSVEFMMEAASAASIEGDSVVVTSASGQAIEGARLLLAFGISDEMPSIPGLAERWGKSVLHCPYCHGYEVSGERLGVLNLTPASLHQALLVSDWGPTTFFTNGAEIDEASLTALKRRNVDIERHAIVGIDGAPGQISSIQLADGRSRPADALFIAPRYRLNSDVATQLGCYIQKGPLGPIITVDDSKATTLPAVFAAGDIARPMHNITFACADGVTAAMAIHRSLVMEM